MSYEVMEISDLAGFEGIEKEWNALLPRCKSNLPFMRHEWLRLWWEHFGESDGLAIITIRKGKDLVAVVPLMETKSYRMGLPFVTLSSMANCHSYRFNMPVMAGEERCMSAVLSYLLNRPRPWHLLQMDEFECGVKAHDAFMEAAGKDGCRAELSHTYSSPYIKIDTDWDSYYGSLKSKFRSNMRNRLKRLMEQGEVSYSLVTGPDGLGEALSRGFEIEKSSWKGEKGTAIACDSRLVSFYTKWAEVAAGLGWLRLSFLTLGGAPVAFDYSLEYNSSMYCMKIGYNQQFSQFSPGQLLCAEILKGCFDRGILEYDFLGDATAQKSDWTSQARRQTSLLVYNRRISSQIHRAYKFKIKQRLKKYME